MTWLRSMCEKHPGSANVSLKNPAKLNCHQPTYAFSPHHKPRVSRPPHRIDHLQGTLHFLRPNPSALYFFGASVNTERRNSLAHETALPPNTKPVFDSQGAGLGILLKFRGPCIFLCFTHPSDLVKREPNTTDDKEHLAARERGEGKEKRGEAGTQIVRLKPVW